MSNMTYMASRRSGGRTSCAPDKRRISVTISEEAFEALRERADEAHQGLSGHAAEILHAVLIRRDGSRNS